MMMVPLLSSTVASGILSTAAGIFVGSSFTSDWTAAGFCFITGR